MEIKFLGTGGAFDYEYGNSAAYIQFRGHKILLDCGNSVYPRLRRSGLADQIDFILLTHLHDDHVGSLNTTILHHKYLLESPRKADILIPNATFQDELYRFLQLGLRQPEEYVNFHPLDQIGGIQAIDTYGLHVPDMQTFAYIFEDENEIVAYSGDLGDPNILFNALPKNGQKSVRVFHEMAFQPQDKVHTYYRDLIPHMAHFAIYGYHLDPKQSPADNPIPLLAHQEELLIDY